MRPSFFLYVPFLQFQNFGFGGCVGRNIERRKTEKERKSLKAGVVVTQHNLEITVIFVIKKTTMDYKTIEEPAGGKVIKANFFAGLLSITMLHKKGLHNNLVFFNPNLSKNTLLWPTDLLSLRSFQEGKNSSPQLGPFLGESRKPVGHI